MVFGSGFNRKQKLKDKLPQDQAFLQVLEDLSPRAGQAELNAYEQGALFIRVRQLELKPFKTSILNNLNFDLRLGNLVALVGSNGAGKSSLLRVLAGQELGFSGLYKLDNSSQLEHIKRNVSYLADSNYLQPNYSLRYYINLFSELYPDFSIKRALELCALLKIDSTLKLSKFSKGKLRCALLVLCFSRNTAVYLLDEPFVGLDALSRDIVLRQIFSSYYQSSLIVLSTHLITELEQYLDEILWLESGELKMHAHVDSLRESSSKSIEELLKDV